MSLHLRHSTWMLQQEIYLASCNKCFTKGQKLKQTSFEFSIYLSENKQKVRKRAKIRNRYNFRINHSVKMTPGTVFRN